MRDVTSLEIVPLPAEVNPMKESKDISIPAGITLTRLRRQVPLTSHLLVKIKVLSEEGKEVGGSLQLKDRDLGIFSLYQGVTYAVNNNSDEKSPWVFLNPVNQPEGLQVSEVSDIPKTIDEKLSIAENRKIGKNRLVILASSPDYDVDQAIQEISESDTNLRMRGAMDEFEKSYPKIPQKELEEIYQASVTKAGLDFFEKSGSATSVFQSATWWNAEIIYTQALVKGELITIKEAVEKATDLLLQRTKSVLDKRIPQLKSLISDRKEMVFSIDKWSIESDNPEEGMPIVVSYYPKKGWTVAFPNGDCPIQAIRAFDSVLQGQRDEENKVFFGSMEAEGDALQLDRNEHTVIYKRTDELRAGYAIYHPGSTLKEALETIRALGDPNISDTIFRRVLFKDTSEAEVEKGSPIVIDPSEFS